jgi:hypothetical protein
LDRDAGGREILSSLFVGGLWSDLVEDEDELDECALELDGGGRENLTSLFAGLCVEVDGSCSLILSNSLMAKRK